MDTKAFYLMIVNKQRKWLSLQEAGIVYDSGWMPVAIGGVVIEFDGKSCRERPITQEEERNIALIANEYSGNK